MIFNIKEVKYYYEYHKNYSIDGPVNGYYGCYRQCFWRSSWCHADADDFVGNELFYLLVQ